MKSFAIINQKGGSGKTSTAILLIKALASTGCSVLGVDCDPQSGLTSFLFPEKKIKGGLFDILIGDQAKDHIITIKLKGLNFDLVACDYRMDKIWASIDPYAIERGFKNLNYDFLVFDTPPTLQGITRSVVMFTKENIIPTDISRASKAPTEYTLKTLRELKKKGKVVFVGYKEPKKNINGYNAKLSREFMTSFKEHYIGTIPRTTSLANVVANLELNWTKAKKEKFLNPTLELIGIK